jgi:hypothetical protein
MARRAKIQHIGIIGKRWFDRVNGNTYNSVQIFVNGARVATLGRGYGYGDHYEQRATQWLVKNGYLPEVDRGYKPLWQYASDLGFTKDVQAIDVKRKKDLDEGESGD